LKSVPAVVTDADADMSVVLAVSENVNRAEMNVVEEGVAFGRWLETTGGRVADLARLLGRSESYVVKRMSVLDLDSGCLDSLVRGEITLHHALELRRVEDPSTREYLRNLAVKNGASVSILSGWVDMYRREGSGALAPDLGPQGSAFGPGLPVPMVSCRLCGRDTSQAMLHAVMICSECDGRLRAVVAGAMGRSGS
jgi:hypothetical protein